MIWGGCRVRLFLGSVLIVISFFLLTFPIFSVPIQISTLQELNKIGRDPAFPMNGEYVLVNDIDAGETINWPGGFEPIGSSTNRFVGSFDGQGYVIRGLYINRPSLDYVGLFGFVQGGVGPGGVIKNLRLLECEINGSRMVGGMVGDLYYGARIENCVFKGVVRGSQYVGGLVGVCAEGSYITKCYTVGEVVGEIYNPPISYIGGFAGVVSGNVLIENSYSKADITTSFINVSYIGGFIGLVNLNCNIVACYSTGKVPEGVVEAGGFIGANNSSNVWDCFWDIETSGMNTSAGGTGLTTTEMKDFNTYSGLSLWDISTSSCFQTCTSIWGIYDGLSYPFLCSITDSVPNVVGLHYSLARGIITNQRFGCKEERVYSNIVPKDYVISTNPAEACLLGLYEEVILKVSDGPYPPKLIHSIEDLQKIGSHPLYPSDGEYWIMNDIDATDTINWNEGRGFIPIPTFRGKLYGLGHKITGLYINNDYDPSLPTGLFSRIEYGTEWEGLVSNLIIEYSNVKGFSKVGILAGEVSKVGDMASAPTIQYVTVQGRAEGAEYVGGLIGYIQGGPSVYDTSIRVDVMPLNPIVYGYSYSYYGGVVGYVDTGGGMLSRVAYSGEIGDDRSGSNLGGIAGYAKEKLYIYDSHANSYIYNCNSYRVGGIVGTVGVNSEIKNTYAVTRFCNPNGPNVGGIIGWSLFCWNVGIVNSFWDRDESGVDVSFCGGTPITSEEMKQRITFESVGWDFDNYWGIIEGYSYPLLKGESFQMPGVVGFYIDNAVSLLRYYGLEPIISETCSNIYSENYVVDQSVRLGEWIKPFSLNPTIWRSTGYCSPIYISTIEQIQSIGKSENMPIDGYYILIDDIDASSTREWNNGHGFDPIIDFRGIFDGNGHMIKNLYINRPETSHVGLFGIIGVTGRVRNTYLLNAEIVGGTYVGILGGGNYGRVSLCGAHGSVMTVVEYSDGVGGLIGVNMNEIERSMAVASVEGRNNVGGLVGLNDNSIMNCYALCEVNGVSKVGGLVGYDNTSAVNMISNCFASGTINSLSPGEYGGLCGYSNTGVCSGCFWDVDVSQIFVSGCGEGKTTIEMKGRTTYISVGWDFTNVWNIYDDETYPFLLEQPQVYVGNYEGFPFLEAYESLTNRGLIVEYVEMYNEQYPAGTIISHTYPERYLPLFYTVEFIVSKGPYPEGEGIVEGEGMGEGVTEGEGVVEGEGGYEGEGVGEGVVEGEGVAEGIIEGEGIVEGVVEGEGVSEGIVEGEGVPEGIIEGEGAIEGDGGIEGEGIIEGEGTAEGEIHFHSADQNGDWKINISELLRVIQFFNSGGYHCAGSEPTEDGYIPGYEGDKNCNPHSSDYNPQDWTISLGELLRLIQFFNMGGYYPCPGEEDGYCPGSP